jgi:DNA-binding IclR family transcriptional regulator
MKRHQVERPQSTTGSIQVLAKSAALLNILAREGERGAAELAAEIDEPRSSVYRLLTSLQELGMIRPGSKRGTFRLGFRLLELGDAVSASFDEREAALPTMRTLRDDSGETVLLCVRRGAEAVCIERLAGEHVQSLALRLGGALPLYAGAAPRVLLAWESSDFREDYLKTVEFAAYTAKTIRSRTALRASLEEARRVGYVISDDDVTLGIAAIAAPIFDYEGRACAALSLSGTRPLIMKNLDGLLRKLMAGADDVSQELGWSPNGSR